jgi:hypothetical protein
VRSRNSCAFLYEFTVSLERAAAFPLLTSDTSAIPFNNLSARAAMFPN